MQIRQRLVLLVSVLLAALLVPLAGPAQAAPYDPDTITGSVYDDNYDPVVGAGVNLYSGSTVVSSTTTDANGAYEFATVAPGTYKVGVPVVSGFNPQYYDGVSTLADATPLTMTSGDSQAYIDFYLTRPPTGVKGTITDPGNNVVSGATVTAYSATGSGWNTYDSTTSGADGSYSIDLPVGTYRIGAEKSGFTTTFYTSATSVGAGQDVSVSQGNQTVADVKLLAAASVTGTVKSGTTNLAGATVEALKYDAQYDSFDSAATTTTNASGVYTLSGLSAGTYIVRFSQPNYVSEYWDNKTSESTATQFALTVGQAKSGVSADLTASHKLGGTVTAVGTGTAVQGTFVNLYDATTDRSVDSTVTDASGHYSFDVADGSYKVEFYANGFLDEFWDDQSDDIDTATPVTVNGSDVTTISPVLNRPGKLHGTVTGPTGSPVSGATVQLYEKGDIYSYKQTTTAADGTWTLTNITPGDYTVGFSATGLAPEYYNGVYDLYDATFLAVDRDTNKTADASMTNALHVTGTVTNAAGTSNLQGVTVTVERKMRRTDGSAYFGELASTTTDANGAYDAGVSPGDYRVRFSKSGYRSEYFGETPVDTRATRFTLTNAGKSAVNDKLDRWGVVSGTVTGAGGSPISGASVQAYYYTGSTWSPSGSATTDGAGKYSIGSLTSDKVRLRFSAPDHTTEFYSGAADVETGTDVSTPLNSSATADAVLSAADGTLAGTVTSASAPLAGATVTVERRIVLPDRTRWEYMGQQTTDGLGAWSMKVRPGTYRVGFEADHKVPEWFSNARSADSATPVTVSASTTSTVNQALDGAGRISGVVSDVAGPVDDAGVTLYRPRGPMHPGEWVEADYTSTDGTGTYTFDQLATGPYRLEFDADEHTSEFYNDAKTVLTGQSVQVTEGQTATANDTLTRWAQMSGTVTNPDGTGASGVFVTIYTRQVVGGVPSVSYWDNMMANPDGTWARRVPAGDYVICASSYDRPFECRTEQPVPETGAVTTVATANVPGQDIALDDPATIKGTVSEDGTGKPLGSATVEPYVNTAGGWIQLDRYERTSDTGAYTLDRLLPGTYRLGFSAAGHTPEFYDGAATVGAATSIGLVANQTKTANASLAKQGTLGGRVLGVDGQPAEDVSVQAYRTDGTYAGGYDYTDADGKYLIALPAGSYKLAFRAYDNRVQEFYNNASTLAAAQSVTVANAAVPLTDVQLGDGAAVSGTVSFPGRPTGWSATVYLRDPATGDLVGQSFVTTTSPTYRIDSLAAGSYRVEFARSSNEIAEGQYWQAKAESAGAASATLVTLTNAQQKTGINASLLVGGTATGTLLSSTTPAHHLSGCQVTAYAGDGSYAPRTTYSGEDGTFRVTGLTTGSYLFRVAGGECGSGNRYYNGTGTLVTTPGDASGKATTRGSNVALGTLSVPVAPAIQNTAAPTITGTAKVGSTLTAQPGTWSTTGLTYAYQWLRSGTAITGATASTYKPTATDVGKQLKVRVTASKTGSPSSSATSAPTAAVAKGTLTCGTPTISGTVKVGKTLTGAPKTCTPAATPTYSWLRNGVVITGKTAKTYTLTATDKGKQIQFRVTWTKAGYTTAVKTSAKTVKVG